MTIQVGQVLDKYELLERVGQGGMAIVYRGLDRSLKRVVAIKILHKHLADYQEARDRFEREAQAVAKLRHENILEIFDYAAKPESEAYIVTEFIDGQTLKQVITERPIAFPEIGAMLIIQVGRALAHAHAGGILHRDVKPENIMIRSDGIVKLMDFGISHMVDLERLTVTGQLLGSPAYMAPEHVEGRPIDYRTDVFALGIVLYQLCVGRLPFEGKNPHEVLKRIAECKFIDPRTANPRIGNRLGRIILRAMAPAPADRYGAVGEMVTALEGYLDESGLPHDKVKLAGELARYFQAPVAFEQALQERLVDHLTKRGKQLLDADDRAGALDVFDRVLTIDAKNEKVIAILDGINRRARLRAIGMGVLAACVISGGAFMIHKKSEPPGAETPAPPDDPGGQVTPHAITEVAHEASPPLLAEVPGDAAVEVDASTAVVTTNGGTRPPAIDAGVTVVPVAIKINVFPSKGSEIQIDNEPWSSVTADGWVARSLERDAVVRVRNECCEQVERVLKYGEAETRIELKYAPASVVPTCDVQGTVSVTVDGRPAQLENSTSIFFTKSLSNQKMIKVEFVLPDNKLVTRSVQVTAGKQTKVPCGEL